jgi:hypothetical protein
METFFTFGAFFLWDVLSLAGFSGRSAGTQPHNLIDSAPVGAARVFCTPALASSWRALHLSPIDILDVSVEGAQERSHITFFARVALELRVLLGQESIRRACSVWSKELKVESTPGFR